MSDFININRSLVAIESLKNELKKTDNYSDIERITNAISKLDKEIFEERKKGLSDLYKRRDELLKNLSELQQQLDSCNELIDARVSRFREEANKRLINLENDFKVLQPPVKIMSVNDIKPPLSVETSDASRSDASRSDARNDARDE